MRRKLKRKITLYTVLLMFTMVTLLHIYINWRLNLNWNEIPTGVHLLFVTVSSLTNVYNHGVQIFDGKNGAAGKDPVIIYWTKVFGKPVKVGDHSWPYFYIEDSCPVKCTLTTDHNMVDDASAIIIHARDIEEMPRKDKIRRKNVRWILHSNESPKFAPALSSAKIMAKFNFYLSYRLDSDFSLSLFPKPLLRPLPVPFAKKRETLAAALYSHCEAVRTEYLVQLMQEIDIDSYGSCLHNTDLPDHIGPRDQQRFSSISKPLLNLYKTYKFTIVFMNSDCDYFVDEKLHYALSAGSVPVFMGTAKIREYLPGNLRDSIIDVRDFPTPKALATYLKKLAKNEEAYNKFLRWKYEGFQFPESYANSTIGQLWESTSPILCRICQKISSGDMGRDGLPIETCERKNFSEWVEH